MMSDVIEEQQKAADDWAELVESRLVDLFLHHKRLLETGFVRFNVVDMHNDGICVGLATAYEILTGEGIDAAIDRFYPPPETTEEMMATLSPTPNEVTH
jgi:hypothetical protein